MISTFLQKPMHKIAKFSFFIDPLLLHFTIRYSGFLSFPFVLHPTLEISARAMNFDQGLLIVNDNNLIERIL